MGDSILYFASNGREGLGGYDVCKAIRREDLETPVVFLTALDSDEHELRGLGVGADAYMAKTVS
ncbi:MAG: response regulator, partial [Paludibacteraceae bacterium]|nr:response regulator [Paludibacteraceae bacterium]